MTTNTLKALLKVKASEISAAHCVEPGGPVGRHALCHVQPDLARLVDQPSGDAFEGLLIPCPSSFQLH